MIVGADTNYASSKNVWVYDGTKVITNISNNPLPVIIAGSNTNGGDGVFLGDSMSSVGVFGAWSKIEPKDGKNTLFDGSTIQGAGARIQADKKELSYVWSYALRGTHIMGRAAKITAPFSWTHDNGTSTNVEWGGGGSKYFALIQGVVTAGGWSEITGQNEGVIAAGSRCNFDLENHGVVLCGLPNEEDLVNYPGGNHISMFSGGGIAILGRGVKRGDNPSDVFTNSKIMCSLLTGTPTILTGNIKLDDKCNIQDTSGNYIVKGGKKV